MYRAQLMQAVDTCLNGLAVLGGDVVDRDRVAVLLGHNAALCATALQQTMQAMNRARATSTAAPASISLGTIGAP